MSSPTIKPSSFGQLFQQAAQLKAAQLATDRRKFDSWPPFYQHTLFARDDIESARKLPPVERIRLARERKARGNQYMCGEGVDVESALREYQDAAALIKYVRSRDGRKGYKEKGHISDEDLEEVDLCVDGEDSEIRAQAKEVLSACYVNMAMAYFKLSDRQNCILACDWALAVLDGDSADDTHRTVKAYYWRAKARLESRSGGGMEVEVAMRDMARAVELQPKDKAMRSEYDCLRREMKEEEAHARHTFGGLFTRGRVYEDVDDEHTHAHTRVCDTHSHTRVCDTHTDRRNDGGQHMTVQEQLRRLEVMATQYEEEDRVQEAEDVRRTIRETHAWLAQQEEAKKKKLKREVPLVDFEHPTEDMVQEAKGKFGLDLRDPRVLECLREMQHDSVINKNHDHLFPEADEHVRLPSFADTRAHHRKTPSLGPFSPLNEEGDDEGDDDMGVLDAFGATPTHANTHRTRSMGWQASRRKTVQVRAKGFLLFAERLMTYLSFTMAVIAVVGIPLLQHVSSSNKHYGIASWFHVSSGNHGIARWLNPGYYFYGEKAVPYGGGREEGELGRAGVYGGGGDGDNDEFGDDAY